MARSMRKKRPFECVPISARVMRRTAAEVLLDPPPMPDLKFSGTVLAADKTAWHEWADRGPQGPIAEGECDGLIALTERHRHRFATLARAPSFNGPREAVLGYAECSEALGDEGAAIAAYEALLARVRDDDNPLRWVSDLHAKIAALRGTT